MTEAMLGRVHRDSSSASLIAHESRLIGPGLPKAVLWTELAITHGEGASLFDSAGNRYLDFMGAGGVNSIGHGHPAVAEAVAAQMRRFTVGSFPSQARARLMDELAAVLPPKFDAVQLYSGGTEAVEAALRLAKSVTGRAEFLAFWGGFHGKTLGSAALTTNGRDAVAPLPGGYFNSPYASTSVNDFGLAPDENAALCSRIAQETVKQNCSRLAAVVIEPVQGRSGNIVGHGRFLSDMDALARRHGALVISDESMTGFGRTGAPFGFQHFPGFEPDILILGKGLGAGYPVTAVAAARELMSIGSFGDPSASSSSFGGFPVACTAAATTLEIIRTEQLTGNAAKLGEWLLTRLQQTLAGCPVVTDVRGLGLALGIQLVDGKTTAGVPVTEAVFRALVDRGLLVMLGGTTLRLYPPLNVTQEELSTAADILVDVLTGPTGE